MPCAAGGGDIGGLRDKRVLPGGRRKRHSINVLLPPVMNIADTTIHRQWRRRVHFGRF